MTQVKEILIDKGKKYEEEKSDPSLLWNIILFN